MHSLHLPTRKWNRKKSFYTWMRSALRAFRVRVSFLSKYSYSERSINANQWEVASKADYLAALWYFSNLYYGFPPHTPPFPSPVLGVRKYIRQAVTSARVFPLMTTPNAPPSLPIPNSQNTFFLQQGGSMCAKNCVRPPFPFWLG